MADLKELQQRDAEIHFAEARAVHDFAEHLRDGVRDLPSESKLGLIFVRYADDFELWATGRNPWPSTALSLKKLERELSNLDDQEEE
jgi:hypothetical protein